MTRRERLERKAEKRREWAEKAKARSAQRFDAAHNLADQIPLGQPILVGHHSEGHARRDVARIQGNMEKGIEEQKLAEHHRGAAAGIERALENSVFSDDVDAVEAMQARIKENEEKRDRMKKVNVLYRKGDAEGLKAMGLDLEKLKAGMVGASSWETAPYPAYALTNLGARIRSDKKRIEEVQVRKASAEKAEAFGVAIEGEADYVRVTFPEKPDREVLDALKAADFHWSGGSWCGYRAKIPESVLAMVKP